MRLNPSQQAVVNARGKRTLAVSGAGTGKTAACTHWVADLVKEGVDPANILMLTFTRKAGEEMKKRAKKLIEALPGNKSAKALTVGNYHSIAVNLLREDPIGFGLRTSKFTILDPDDTEKLWKAALRDAGIEKPEGPWIPTRFAGTVSKIVNWCRDPIKVLPRFFPKDQVTAVQAYRNYVSIKRATDCVDFDDLLVFWARRLKDGFDPAWKAKFQAKWKYVLVDEFQDNNPLNAEIIRRMNPECLLVVGDGNQAIYGFRNADPSLMEKFKAEDPDTVLLKLEDNYRSGKQILDLANTIVAQSVCPLVLRSGRGTEGVVEYRVYPEPRVETTQAVLWVQDLLRQGVKPNEICILSRSSFAFREIEVGLKHLNIPYKKYGGLSLADAAEVKDYMSILKLLHNPKDNAAWMRALVQFPRMGEKGAMNFLKKYPTGEVPHDAWPPQAHKLRDWLGTLRELPGLKTPLKFLVNQMEWLIEFNYKNDYEKRMLNLRAIEKAETDDSRPLTSFLDSFAVEQFSSHTHPETHITISTIHSSKGLEWDYVWLVGVGDLQMPHKRSVTVEEKQEELRLAYVAVTRARDHLVCSYGEEYGPDNFQDPCPYFPEGLPWKWYDNAGLPIRPPNGEA